MVRSFKHIRLKSARKFLECLSPLGPMLGTKQMSTFASGNGQPTWVFRGHGNAEYTLLPSALRAGQELLLTGGWKALEGTILNGDQAGAEYSSLLAFFWSADEQGLSLPEDSQTLRSFFNPSRAQLNLARQQSESWPPDSVLSIMALAQHYGIPTRLLDWSYNPLVACYFAAVPTHTVAQNLCVWALDLSAFQQIDSKHKAEVFLRFVSAPRSENANLLAQDGLFTLYSTISFNWDAPRVANSIDQLASSWEGIRDIPILYKIELPRDEDQELLRQLRRYGITGARLFPGYAGVVKSLRERGAWGGGWGFPQGVQVPAYYPPHSSKHPDVK
jgi:hypothetical protein